MKKIAIYAVVAQLVFFPSAYSAGPFGDVTNKTFKYGRDQSGCTAERLLENAINDTGIDLISGSTNYVWGCSNGEGPATATSRRCPYDQHMKDQNYRCYSNVKSGFPYICVSGAKSENVSEVYSGDEKPQEIPRARFSEIFVFQGGPQEKQVTMDSKGCEAASGRDFDETGLFNNGTVESEKSKCIARLKSALTGGYIYEPMPEFKRKGTRYCEIDKAKDPSYIDSYLTKTKELYHCYEIFPNLPDLYKKSEGSSKGLPTSKEAVR